MTAVPPTYDQVPFTGTDDDNVPEQPMVIAWEELDTTTYNTTLPEMATWVDRLVHHPPPAVRRRHDRLGLGRSPRAHVQRLRDVVAASGCTSRAHTPVSP